MIQLDVTLTLKDAALASQKMVRKTICTVKFWGASFYAFQVHSSERLLTFQSISMARPSLQLSLSRYKGQPVQLTGSSCFSPQNAEMRFNFGDSPFKNPPKVCQLLLTLEPGDIEYTVHIDWLQWSVQGCWPGSIPVWWNGITTGKEGGVCDGVGDGAGQRAGSADPWQHHQVQETPAQSWSEVRPTIIIFI